MDDNPRILVVDDEVSITKTLSIYLKGMSYDVTTTNSPQEAFNILEASNNYVIVTDIVMSEMSGIELMDRVLKINPEAIFIGITGFGDDDTSLEFIKKGGVDYLQKPLSLSRLELTVNSAVKRYKLLRNIFNANKNLANKIIELENEIKVRKKAENALQASYDDFKILFDSVDDFLFILDLNACIIDYNPVVKKRLKYSHKELKGANILEIHSPHILDEIAEHVLKMLSGLETTFSSALITKNGENIDIETKITKGRWKEENVLFGVSRDITKRLEMENRLEKLNKELIDINLSLEERVKLRTNELEIAKQEAENANKAKSLFLANMTHDLRTPLTGILGYTQLLQANPNFTKNQIDSLNIINSSGEHLLLLINDILDFSKVEAAKMVLEPSDFSFPIFIKSIIDIIKIRIKQKHIDFIYNSSNIIPKYVYCDSKRLRQVLLNLLGNAVKFTDKGSVSFNIHNKNNKFYFEVKDTGIGIPEKDYDAIFLPFKQVGSGKNNEKGTGLGLSISQEIIRLMGGEIKVESKVGVGTKFWFEIYIKSVDSKADENIEVREIKLHGDGHKIMVVDDDDISRNYLTQILKASKFNVLSATDGYNALEEAIEFKPELILMDIEMPVLDGYQALKKIHQVKELQYVKIIAISAQISEIKKQYILDYGFEDFILAPYSSEIIFSKIQKCLGLKFENKEKIEYLEMESDIELDLPSAEELDQLYNNIMTGNVVAIMKQTNKIRETSIKYTPFIEKVDGYAKNFKINQLKDFINSVYKK